MVLPICANSLFLLCFRWNWKQKNYIPFPNRAINATSGLNGLVEMLNQRSPLARYRQLVSGECG